MVIGSRNEISPLRALTPIRQLICSFSGIVEMKSARLGH